MKRFERFDPAALAELRARQLPKLRAADIATIDPDADPEDSKAMLSALDEYVSHFVELGERDPVWKSRLCICCGQPLTGLLTGTFQWGLAYGEGSCFICTYPARAIHRIEGVGTLSTLVLQYHPDELSFASEAPMPWSPDSRSSPCRSVYSMPPLEIAHAHHLEPPRHLHRRHRVRLRRRLAVAAVA